ncbi:MAG: putative hemolysin [Chlamydiales bacterium]
MNNTALMWLSLTLMFIFVQAFYSMAEMASVSFNKIRLQYYVSRGNKQAIWLNFLLQNPSRLFGTTLLGVNVALQVGSECSRQFYESMNLPPDLAPFTQVFLVLIFAELVPMFAARHYAEHVALLSSPLVYASSRLVKPLVWGIGLISEFANRLIGGRHQEASAIYLTREELQRVFEEREEAPRDSKEIKESDDFNTIVSNIFNFRRKTAEQAMTPTHEVPMIPANSSISHLRAVLNKAKTSAYHIPVYLRSRRNIVGVVSIRDVLSAPGHDQVQNYYKPPWFLAHHTKILQILEQFQRNNQSLAVVLDGDGLARGILTLEDILDEIFGDTAMRNKRINLEDLLSPRVIERTFPGTMEVRDFNEQFNARLEFSDKETLAELLSKHFDHLPEAGESVRLDRFELTVEEAALMGAKTITVRTVID